MADKYLLLLHFSSGVIEPLPLSPDVFAHDRIVIAIDELNGRVWIWQGANTSLIERRAAQRKARSLLSAGYQLGHLKVGQGLHDVEIIDGELMDDQKTKQTFDLLVQTIRQPFTLIDGVLGRISGDIKPAPTAAAASPAPSPTPPAPVRAEQVTQPRVAPAAAVTVKETVASAPSRQVRDLGIIRMGILLASLLEHFPLLYVSSTREGGKTRYKVEDPEGVICETEVSRDTVHFLKRYDFRGKRKEILTSLRDRLASAAL